MKLKKRYFRIGCCTAVAAVWAMLLGQYACAEQIKTGFVLTPDQVIKLAQNDPERLFKRSLARFDATIYDYTGLLYKQERIRGKLGKEKVVEFKFKAEPYSILMQWIKNPGQIDKLLYVENKNDNKMLVHPTGLLSFVKSAKRDPYSKEVKRASLKTCTEFGFLKIIQELINEYHPEIGEPKVTTKYVNTFEMYDRKFIKLEQTIKNPQDGKDAKRTILYDIDLMIPIERQAYDSKGKLLYKYVYRDLRFNTGLTDEDFTPEANDLK
jgi:hypothetical protein